MTQQQQLLPHEVAALVEHVELNREGWWEKATQRLVLAAIWLAGRPLKSEEIRESLEKDLSLKIGLQRLQAAIESLEQELLLVGSDDGYRIPVEKRQEFETQIGEAEAVAKAARDRFLDLAASACPTLDAQRTWEAFEERVINPLLAIAGANAHSLITGEQAVFNDGYVEKFLAPFPQNLHTTLRQVAQAFLDPKDERVRDYIGRMLHARFCVDASGLPEELLSRIRATVGRPVKFRLFVDTNVLFSFLGLHENPSNIAADELKDLISTLQDNLEVKLCVFPVTLDEARKAIATAKSQVTGIPTSRNFTDAAVQGRLSGIAERYFAMRNRSAKPLTPKEWFDPFLTSLIHIAKANGVELFNEDCGAYSMREEVTDDINAVMRHENKLAEHRRKTYRQVRHDMVIWHSIRDKRTEYIESPLEAQDWILTADFRLIGFDRHKQKRMASPVPLCVHPTSFIQLLRFWIPRNADFEQAMLGTLRLPFLFQEFDSNTERITLLILNTIGRFENSEHIPEEAITNVLLNESLRSRLDAKHSEADEDEIQLIRDTLVEAAADQAKEALAKARESDAREAEAQQALRTKSEQHQATQDELSEAKTCAEATQSELHTATQTIQTRDSEIQELRDWKRGTEEKQRQRRARLHYGTALLILAAATAAASSCTPLIFPILPRLMGILGICAVAGVVTFALGHILIERFFRHSPEVQALQIFTTVKRFRRRRILVIFTFLLGAGSSLYATYISNNAAEIRSENATSQQSTSQALAPDPTPLPAESHGDRAND